MNDAIRATTLGNGLRVVSERVPGLRSASIGAWFGVGGRDEPDERAGASHFLEHLLFKGTHGRSARAVAEAIDGVGGDMNAFTAREYTTFYARVPSSARQMATELLFDVIANPALRPVDVDAERQVINEELVAAFDTPDDVVHIALYEALFNGHSLGREVLGLESTIASMTSDDIGAFHREWYRPANMVIAAAGDIDHDELVAEAESTFGGLDCGVVPERRPPGALSASTVSTAFPAEQAHVALGWRGLSHDDPDRFAYALANQILGGSPSSRLFQDIRESHALAYTVFSTTSGYADTGSATVYAATSAGRGAELLDSLDAAIDDLTTNGVTPHEVELARQGFEGSVVLSLEDSGSRMHRLGTNMALRGTVLDLDAWVDQLAAVTVDDVNAVAARVWGGPCVRSVVAPDPGLYDLHA